MKRANRILLLVTQADWGGVQSFLVRFAKQLKAEGREVLLAAGGEGELWAEAEKAGIPTRKLERMTRAIHPVKDWSAIGEIEHLIREFKPDAIHLNSSKMGVLGSIASAALKKHGAVPWTVYRIGGWSFLEPISGWKRWLYRTAERTTAKYKDVIVTVHPGDERIARDLRIIPRKTLVTVPNGLDLASFVSALGTRNASRQSLGLSEHAFVFGTVANAYATKGLLAYLDVAARVCALNDAIRFVIIGEGPQSKELERKRDALGLADRVVLPGQRTDAGTLYPAFDVFVLPSVKEGMPWTLLEAMAAGIPCVATDVGACAWMLEDSGAGRAGEIVPPHDALAMVRALDALRNDKEKRAALSRAARFNVTDRFSWKKTFEGNRDALDSRP